MANTFTYKTNAIHVGDRISVHQRILEEGKTRIQIFDGVVIGIKNRNEGQSFTVRKIGAGGIGIERIYPANSPNIENITVKNRGDVRRAKLYYLRGRVGRQALRVKEKSS
jgi:large subunit ribosomal protein L19